MFPTFVKVSFIKTMVKVDDSSFFEFPRLAKWKASYPGSFLPISFFIFEEEGEVSLVLKSSEVLGTFHFILHWKLVSGSAVSALFGWPVCCFHRQRKMWSLEGIWEGRKGRAEFPPGRKHWDHRLCHSWASVVHWEVKRSQEKWALSPPGW